MAGNPGGHRLYTDLAPWWPLISGPQEYTEEAELAAAILASAAIDVREVLELGSGGGHNAVHLKRHFRLTLTDVSGDMLAVSRRLNPECAHHQADMRTVRLGREFDAVFRGVLGDGLRVETRGRQQAEPHRPAKQPGPVAVLHHPH